MDNKQAPCTHYLEKLEFSNCTIYMLSLNMVYMDILFIDPHASFKSFNIIHHNIGLSGVCNPSQHLFIPDINFTIKLISRGKNNSRREVKKKKKNSEQSFKEDLQN